MHAVPVLRYLHSSRLRPDANWWDEQEEKEEKVDEEVANEQSAAQLVNFVAVEHIYFLGVL